MNDPASIDWLAKMWGLPEEAFDSVRRLLQAEAQGSTACEVEQDIVDWGNAAGPEEADSPLVLTGFNRKTHIQSRRLFLAEREIADRLLSLASLPPTGETFTKSLKVLFPDAAADDLQARAALTAATRHLAVVTGGPGTGKTYVLARILALLTDHGMATGSIRLAAPTGKAADRMKKAVGDSVHHLPKAFRKHADLLNRTANSSATIHSLLGYNPDTGRCRFDRNNPLPCQTLILDECSMIDVHLWRALLRALPDDSRLVLLGDPNQLESVGQGNVFFDVARAAECPESPLHPLHVHLTGTRRFKDSPRIVALAQALEKSDAAAAEELLARSAGPEPCEGLAWIESAGGPLPCENFPPRVLKALARVATADSAREALDALAGVCVLTAQREFFVGSKAVSAQIEKHFSLHEGVRNHPVIINHNDPETGLRNGTVGIIHLSSNGSRKAFFPSSDGHLTEFAVSRLPDYSPAWAITIHRSQGSEYEDTLVILPREESPMATRQLLYTAITRAKSSVCVAGDLETVKKAVITSSSRCTMLPKFLIRQKPVPMAG